jgi:hypothetical protein
MVGVAARTQVRDQGIKGRLRSSNVHPITAGTSGHKSAVERKETRALADGEGLCCRLAIWLVLILVTITATIHIVPTLLHPLFGSIPVNLHKESTIHGMFALSAVLLVSWPRALNCDMAILAGLSGLDLVVLATAYKKAARLGGDWFGAVGGATGALVVLCVGPILIGAAMWSRTMASKAHGSHTPS